MAGLFSMREQRFVFLIDLRVSSIKNRALHEPARRSGMTCLVSFGQLRMVVGRHFRRSEKFLIG